MDTLQAIWNRVGLSWLAKGVIRMITTSVAWVAILQATAHGRETRERVAGGVVCSGPMVAHGLDCGAVLAAMERCPRPVEDWLLAAYAAEGYPGVAQAAIRCQAALYAEYTRRRVVRSCTQKMFTLAGVVMHDFRERRKGNPARGIAWYAGEVRFKPENWATWSKAVTAMMDILEQWDCRGLREVGAILQRDAA